MQSEGIIVYIHEKKALIPYVLKLSHPPSSCFETQGTQYPLSAYSIAHFTSFLQRNCTNDSIESLRENTVDPRYIELLGLSTLISALQFDDLYFHGNIQIWVSTGEQESFHISSPVEPFFFCLAPPASSPASDLPDRQVHGPRKVLVPTDLLP